jgi:hypothetical protein
MTMTRYRRTLSLLAVVATSGVFFIDLCGVLFRCGCRSLWNGAAFACNIHAAEGPHCPWCEHPVAGGAVAFFAMVAVQSWIVRRPGRFGLATRVALALAAFPVTTALIAAIQRYLWSD